VDGNRISIPVARLLWKLGADIRDARRRRRIATAVMAERASMSRTTLNRIEKGDPNTSIGSYFAVLHALGIADRFADAADLRHDETGMWLEEEHLPKRIRNVKEDYKK
jgi:transcriptional regulator with XRE-family HTH domain